MQVVTGMEQASKIIEETIQACRDENKTSFCELCEKSEKECLEYLLTFFDED